MGCVLLLNFLWTCSAISAMPPQFFEHKSIHMWKDKTDNILAVKWCICWLYLRSSSSRCPLQFPERLWTKMWILSKICTVCCKINSRNGKDVAGWPYSLSGSKCLCKNFWWGWLGTQFVSLGMIQSLFSSVLCAKTEYIGFRLYSASPLNPLNHSPLSDNLRFVYPVPVSCRVLASPFAFMCLWYAVSLFSSQNTFVVFSE